MLLVLRNFWLYSRFLPFRTRRGKEASRCKIYAVKEKTRKKQTNALNFHHQGKKALLDFSHFKTAQWTTETSLCEKHLVAFERSWGVKTLFLNPGVCSSEQCWRVHTAMMDEWKRGWRWKTTKACQASLMCNISASLPKCTAFFLCTPAFPISICCFWIFLLQALSLSLAVSLFLSVSNWLSGVRGRRDKPNPALM